MVESQLKWKLTWVPLLVQKSLFQTKENVDIIKLMVKYIWSEGHCFLGGKGSKVMCELSHDRWIVSQYYFNLVYWDGMEAVLLRFSEMFCMWVMNYVSYFCGKNCQFSRINKVTKNMCPSCGCSNKLPGHITCCQDPGWSKMFHASANTVVEWLRKQRTGEPLIAMIADYLTGYGGQ